MQIKHWFFFLNNKLKVCKIKHFYFLTNKRSTESMHFKHFYFLTNKRSTEIMHISNTFFYFLRYKRSTNIMEIKLSQQQKLNLQRQRYALMAHQQAAGSSRGQKLLLPHSLNVCNVFVFFFFWGLVPSENQPIF